MKQKEIDRLLKQGEDLFASGDLPGAEACFKKILDINPHHIEAVNDIGVIAFMRSDFLIAMDYFKKALEIDGRYPKAIENYAKSLIAAGDHLAALNFIRESFKSGVMNIELLNMMGNCFVELKDITSAKAVFEKSLSLNTDQEEVVTLLGKIENDLKEGGEVNPPALPNNGRLPSIDATKVNKIDKGDFDYKLFWNNRYRAGGNSGLGSSGVLADFKADVINEFIRGNAVTGAIEFGCGDGNQISLIDYPDYIGLDISGAAVTMCRDRFDQDLNKKFIVCTPSDYRGLNLKKADLVLCLDVLYHIIDEDDFIETLDAIFMHSDKYVILYTMLHEPSNKTAAHIKFRDIYSYLNKYPQFEIYRTVEQKYPDLSGAAFIILRKKESDSLLDEGERHFSSGNLSGAEKCFREILDNNPRHIQALNNMGVIFFQKSDNTLASEYFKKALEIDERYIDAIENYAKCLMTAGDHLGALNLIRNSFKSGIMNTDLLNMMGNCFIELEDLKSAKAAFEKSLLIEAGQEEIFALKCKVEEILSYEASMNRVDVSMERMNIGFVSIWFERGQSYVTKTLRDCLSKQHATFILARTGGVYGVAKLEKSGSWDVPNLTTYPEYKIPQEFIKKWIRENNIQTVIFNEEYDWDLVRAAKETGMKVITYLDYYKDDWKRDMGLYDAVMCSTLRTYNLVKNSCKAAYIGWCVDLNLFKPSADDLADKYTFFHNAGWLGINYRKMTPAVILAFDAVSRIFKDASLLIHAQADMDKLPAKITEIIRSNPRINYHVATLPAPGLYNKGKVLLFPSKLEGLGLPLPEGLACGLPVIATNAPPMNEFIKSGYNGLLARVAHRITRQDDISFPEEIVDLNDLALKMAEILKDPEMIKGMGENARRFAETELNPESMVKRLNDLMRVLRN